MATQSKNKVLEEETLVDADVHLAIPDEELLPYLEEPHVSRVKHTSLGASPRDGWDRTIGGKISDEKYMNLRDNLTPQTLRDDLLDEFHIDRPIINTFAAMSRNPEPDYSIGLMKAHNDLLLDRFLDPVDEFKGIATITTQRPEAAAEELDRMGDEKDIVGAYIHNTGPTPPLGDQYYDVMYQAAEDNGLNIVFHGSANGMMYEFPRQNQSLNKFLEVHTLSHAWSQMLTMTSIIVEGTVEKFPDLDFAFLEAGLSWASYLAYRLNKEYSMRRSEAPLLEKSPEEYVRDRMYFGAQPLEEPNDPEDLNRILDIIGYENILFCTDYPHWDFDTPNALDRHLRATFDPEERTRVLSENAAEFFGLSL